MNRRRFLGTAAAGIAGAGMLGSGTVHAASPGGPAKVLVVMRRGYRSQSGGDDWCQILAQAVHVLEEAGYPNLDYWPEANGKGYKILDLHAGFPSDQWSAADTKAKIWNVWNSGFHFDAIIACTGSTQAQGIEDFQKERGTYVPHIQSWAVTRAANGALPQDPPSPYPGNLFLRTTNNGAIFGEAQAWIMKNGGDLGSLPASYSGVAYFKRVGDGFGDSAEQGFLDALGNPLYQQVLMTTNPDKTITFDPDPSTLFDDGGNWLIGSANNTDNVYAMVEALATHGYKDNLYLGMVGSVTGKGPQLNTDFGDWLNTNARGLIKWYDVTGLGFQHYYSWSGVIAPESASIALCMAPESASIALCMADGARLMVNGLETGLRGQELYDMIIEASRHPKRHPNFFIDELTPLNWKLNYEGASGPIDMDDYGESAPGFNKVWIGNGAEYNDGAGYVF
jgi:hypothetical protein